MNEKISVLAVFAILLLAACSGGGSEPSEPADTTTPADQPPAASLSKGTASISGTVKFDGQPPRMRPIAMDADPQCKALHTEPVPSEGLVIGDGGGLANVFISVKSGLPSGTWPIPSEPAVMDQRGCQYIPHVFGIMAEQPLKIVNSDGVLHNVHALPKVNAEFNQAMPKSLTEITKEFSKPEAGFRIKCDVHPWMGAWVHVLSHPFFATSGADGTYQISDLPAGTYQIEAWHENSRLPAQTQTITVAEGESETADFTFARPQ